MRSFQKVSELVSLTIFLLCLAIGKTKDVTFLKKDLPWQDFVDSNAGSSAQAFVHDMDGLMRRHIRLNSRLKACNTMDTYPPLDCAHSNLYSSFVTTWANKTVSKGFCDTKANSRITCVDSTGGGSRVCIFDNVMIDFRKMRTKKRDGRVATRIWERGFITADVT